MAATPDGGGYWLVASEGREFAFGGASSDGSAPGLGIDVRNIVGMVLQKGPS
jgi:hypothetical protein